MPLNLPHQSCRIFQKRTNRNLVRLAMLLQPSVPARLVLRLLLTKFLNFQWLTPSQILCSPQMLSLHPSLPYRLAALCEDLDIAPPADIVPGASPAPSHRSLSYEFEAPAHSPPAGFNEAPHSSPTGFDEDTFSRQESPVPSEPEHHADPDPVPQPPAPQPANTDIPIEMPPTALEILTNSSHAIIFITLGLLTGDSDAPITLLTTLHRLHLRDNFEIKAIPPSSSRAPRPMRPTHLLNPSKPPRVNTKSSVPRLQTPFSLLSTQLPEYIVRLESSLDAWRTREPTPDGELRSVQDGKLWNASRTCGDGVPFFDNRPDRADPDELRIGVTLGFDG
ncbi:hypothetical protein B0H21DRAFT_708938, partial [Amylocystis lapponica]